MDFYNYRLIYLQVHIVAGLKVAAEANPDF